MSEFNNTRAPDPRIAELEAENKQLSELVQLLDPEVAKLEAECERLRGGLERVVEMQRGYCELYLNVPSIVYDLADAARETLYPPKESER